MKNLTQYPWQQPFVIRHTQRLFRSFQHWTGETLLEVEGTPEEIAQALFEAPFMLVSHGTESDPIFNYGNHKALEMWAMTWEELTRMPSRQTAEPVEQAERNRLLAETTAKGFVDNFQVVRISKTGQRFRIEDGRIWNLLDEQHQFCGKRGYFF